MTKKIKIIVLTNIIILLLSICAYASEESLPKYMNTKTLVEYSETTMPDTISGSISVYNTESGLSIYEKNADKKVYPASTVKIMTAIIAYESIKDLSVPIEVSRKVYNQSVGSKLGLKIGDIYTAEDLIKAVLISGSNDAANQLAEYVTNGNNEQFVTMMNDKAKALGCKNTHFTNVTGLHDSNMYTTANDMMKIARYAYNLGELASWSNIASYYFTPINDPNSTKLRYNRNYFVARNVELSYYYKNSFGLSAGSTPQAGNCLVTSASRNGCTYICVIMDSPYSDEDKKNHTYKDAKNIFDTLFRTFEFKSVADTSIIIEELELKLCTEKDFVSLYPSDVITYLLPKSIDENTDLLQEKIIYSPSVNAPIFSGDEFGELIVKYKDDFIIGKTKLICKESYEQSTVLYAIEKIKSFITSSFFIVTVTVAIILFIIYAFVSFRNRNKSKMFKSRRY